MQSSFIPPAPVYSGSQLNRMAERRGDAAWLAQLRADPGSRFWPLVDQAHPVSSDTQAPVWLTSEDLGSSAEPDRVEVLLGIDTDGHAEFAVGVGAGILDRLAGGGRPCALAELRQIGPRLPRALAARLAYARAMLVWHGHHRHCPRCGGATRVDGAGHRRVCGNPECGVIHFPRTDPAVIMLIENGEHCLLGRQPHWPAGMHSVLAGFVEPGESLEEAVAREVWEEAGVAVCDIRYRVSQPWPFPASIMLGFRARALTGKVFRRDAELEAARWYHRDELLGSPEDETFRLPRADSVARLLLNEWLGGAGITQGVDS